MSINDLFVACLLVGLCGAFGGYTFGGSDLFNGFRSRMRRLEEQAWLNCYAASVNGRSRHWWFLLRAKFFHLMACSECQSVWFAQACTAWLWAGAGVGLDLFDAGVIGAGGASFAVIAVRTVEFLGASDETEVSDAE